MHPLEEVLQNVGFTAKDGEALRALWPAVRARLPDITRHFTDALARSEDAARMLADEARAERLREALARSLEELCTGPADVVALERRQAAALAQVRLGVAPRALVTAMHAVRDELVAIVDTVGASAGTGDAAVLRAAVLRVIDVELALLLDATVEQRERSLLRDALDGSLANTTLLIDASGRVVATTTPTSPILARREVAGAHVRDALLPPIAGASAIEDVIVRALETRRAITIPRVDTEAAGADVGAGGTYRVTVLPIDSGHAHALVHIEDVTNVVAHERQAGRREQAARMQSLASTVAHEIKNPLAAISGTVQVVASSLDAADPQREALHRVQDEVIRLGDLVGDLLAFAQPHDPQAQDAELGPVVKAATRQVDAALGVATRVEGAGRARLDAGLLSHVVFNVVENAWQAGARRVVVRIEDGAVRVVDDGPGIPAPVAARLFEPFFTTKTRGTGLGLPIAQRIIEAMGGTLSVCPSDLGGAGFLMRLPLPDGARRA